MSGRGDSTRGRGGHRGRGGDTRGSSPSGSRSRGPSPSRGHRGSPVQPRGGQGFRGGGRGGGPGGGPAPPAVAAPPQGPPVVDKRIASMEDGVKRFQVAAKAKKDPKHPLRPGFGTLGTPIVVRANFFAIKYPKGLVIHDYRINITPKTDIGRLKGRVIELLVDTHPDFAKYRPFVAHDRSERMICCRALPQPLGFDVTFIEEGETRARTDAKKYHVEIVKTEDGELDTDDLAKYNEGAPANKDMDIGRLVSALNMVVQMGASRTGIRSGKNRYFFDPAQRTLDGGLEAWRGFFASVRPVWREMMVNINVCMTAFVEQKNMATAIMDFQRGSRGAVPDLAKMFGKTVLKVRTKHLGYRKPVKAIASVNARQHKFDCKELGGTVTVEAYFLKKYPNHPLKHPELPLVIMGKENYVPAELCDIVQGLPYRGRLNDRQTSDMLRLACQSPQTNSDLIRGEGFAKLAISESNKHEVLKNWKVSIEPNMAVVPARILPPPGLSYAVGRPRVNDGSWNILDVKFHRGGVMGRWGVMVVRDPNKQDRFQGPNDPSMWALIQGFAEKCKKAGMMVASERPKVLPAALPAPNDRDPSRSAAVAKLKETMLTFANDNPRPSFILVLLNHRDNYIYPGIKRIGDVELGIHTVCMQLDKAMGDPKKQDQYFSNVALKVNTKLGGINHKLDGKDLKWLQEKRTMVVGADVTHPGPTSMDGTPSLAAVVASIDSEFVQFPASMQLQTSKVEMIQDFTGMMVERLLLYQTRTKGALPERVLVFRDGVSEGQFDLVLKEELPQIREAFEKVYTGKDGKPAKKPELMICICGKRHHARFYPTNDQNATRNGNTKPGTVVDKGIGDVYRFDFYLQAHAGLQGTVKATHYTVVYDEIGYTANDIQQGTHSASYAYVRATKAVSLIPPAYYADLACERGRLYLNDFLNLGAEKGSVAGSVSSKGKKGREEQKKEIYDACFRAWGNGIHGNVKNSMFYI